jgi:hypothetical protein
MQVLIAELSIVIVKAEFDRARAELKVDFAFDGRRGLRDHPF